MNSTSMKNPFKPIVTLIKRFNLTLFIVIVVGGLIVSIMILTNIVNKPYEEVNVNTTTTATPTSTTESATFDQTTINRLVKFETSDKNTNYQSLPSGRTEPFSG